MYLLFLFANLLVAVPKTEMVQSNNISTSRTKQTLSRIMINIELSADFFFKLAWVGLNLRLYHSKCDTTIANIGLAIIQLTQRKNML